MVGSTVGHYQILERIGAGGMGVVYRARDLRLERDVALKLLPEDLAADPERIARLTTEARAVAGLNHPNIVTLFSMEEVAGRHFLTMELVSGHTLERSIVAGGMPLERLLAIARALTEALVAAHRVGVLHRDLKPSNVMLTDDGRTKVLDFGLARRVGAATPSATSQAETAADLTREGVAVGTLPYMPPEQLLGRSTDARADLYSLGALLYELASGRRPLSGGSDAELVGAILRDAPPPLSRVRAGVPLALERLVARCLEKDPTARHASSAEVLAELAAIASGAAPAPPEGPPVIRALAVLPLENLSRDPAQEYFADGMTEALIFDLSRIKALRVISRTSAMKYKGAARPLPEIAAELQVDAILEGAAMLAGKRVRVSVKLVAARTEETLWAERYDGDLEDVLGMQATVAEAVAREIAVQVTPTEAKRLAERPVVHAEAHVEYLKGRYHDTVGSTTSLELSLRHFERALELDPGYAAAWAGVAEAHLARATRGMVPPIAAAAAAEAAAHRALALDPALGEAYTALAKVCTSRGDFAGGRSALERALELSPGQAFAHRALGALHYSFERHDDALREMLHALSLDPLSMLLHTAVGDALYYARRYEESLPYYRKAVELDGRFDGAHTDLARSLEATGRFDEARAEYEEGRRLSGGVAGPSFGLAHLEISMGNAAGGRRQADQLAAERAHRIVSAWGLATLYARLGESDTTFRWLEEAVAERATGLVLLRVHPRLDAVRSDPRYAALVRRVGLDVA